MWDARDRKKDRNAVPLQRKGKGDYRLVISFHDRNEGSCRRMNGTGKGKSCRSEEDSFLLLLFAEKSELLSLELEMLWIEKPRLEGMFHVSKT